MVEGFQLNSNCFSTTKLQPLKYTNSIQPLKYYRRYESTTTSSSTSGSSTALRVAGLNLLSDIAIQYNDLAMQYKDIVLPHLDPTTTTISTVTDLDFFSQIIDTELLHPLSSSSSWEVHVNSLLENINKLRLGEIQNLDPVNANPYTAAETPSLTLGFHNNLLNAAIDTITDNGVVNVGSEAAEGGVSGAEMQIQIPEIENL